MLCDGRMVCGCADPYAKRVLGDVRTTSLADIWHGPTARQLRADLNGGGSSFCGDCPLKLPLGRRRGAAAARPERRRRCPAGCTSSAPPPATSRASRRAARPRPASRGRARPACSTGICSRGSWTRPGPSLVPHRLLQLRRGVPAQARRRDVRVHQDEVPAHLSLHQHQRAGAHRGEGAAAGALGHRRGHLLDRRRVAGHLREVPAARQFRQGAGQPARDGRREGEAAAATCRSINWRYILFNWNDHDEEMDTARRRWRPRPASIGCAGRSPTTPRTRSRAASCPGTPDYERIRHESLGR